MLVRILFSCFIGCCSLAPISGQNPMDMVAAPSQEKFYTLEEDVVWATVEERELTLDIYQPTSNRVAYPVVIIFHGGGWLINDKSIMDDMAEYLATHGEFVVVNVDYRLLPDAGNTVTMNEIVEDAFGAVLWVKDHIIAYRGNPWQVVVTGDSAGGHLASMVVLAGRRLESDGFGGPTLGFKPTYLPEGETAEQVAARDGLAVQAAVISYGAFDLLEACQNGFEEPQNFFWSMAQAQPRGIFGDSINLLDHPSYYQAVSPVFQIPSAQEHALPPMLFTVGENDNLTPPASVEAFVAALRDAGHEELRYWLHEGRPHAFMDSGKNDFLGINFQEDAVPALKVIIDFLNEVLR